MTDKAVDMLVAIICKNIQFMEKPVMSNELKYCKKVALMREKKNI
jgi:hypothetical protein